MTWDPKLDPSHFTLGAINALGQLLRPDGTEHDARRMLARFDHDQLWRVELAATALATTACRMRSDQAGDHDGSS